VAVDLRQVTSGIGTAGTSHSIPSPSTETVLSGDEIVFVIQWWTGGSVPNQSTGLTAHGFTFQGRQTAGGQMAVEVWTKISSGSEPANYTSIAINISATPYYGFWVARGADPAGGTLTPAFINMEAATTTTHPMPAASPSRDGSLVITTCSLGTGNTITPPSPYSDSAGFGFDVADGWAGASYEQATAAAIAAGNWISVDSTGRNITSAIIVQPEAAVAGPQTWDFTGANGAAWPSPWTKTSAGTTTADIQSNRGRLVKGTTAWDMAQVTYGAAQHFELAGEVYPTNVATQHWIIVRIRETGGNTYYSFEMDPSLTTANVYVKRWAAGVDQGVISGSASNVTFSTSAGRSFRIRVAASLIKYRTWVTGTTEPSTWDVEIEDANITGSGQLRMEITEGTTTARSASFDNFSFESIDALNLTMRPNAALTLSGFSGAYTDIDEDAASPDAAYLEPV
jgi:hypothetical protein